MRRLLPNALEKPSPLEIKMLLVPSIHLDEKSLALIGNASAHER